ncbi:MAG: ribonuclease HI [bacterium]|nr:ribonuclease HI [bacterium]
MITIYTDGSSRGNPGPGGWGAIIATKDRIIEMGGGEKHTTNNRMELSAAICALEGVKKNNLGNEITLLSDSTYVVKGITEWIFNWQKKNWKTAGKKPVENKDLWERLFEATKNLNISWKTVPGHAGVEANERCDEIATSYAGGEKVLLYKDSLKNYSVNLEWET